MGKKSLVYTGEDEDEAILKFDILGEAEATSELKETVVKPDKAQSGDDKQSDAFCALFFIINREEVMIYIVIIYFLSLLCN